jgi:dTDP-4-amino-4,6-dideoxygalactose transaminase
VQILVDVHSDTYTIDPAKANEAVEAYENGNFGVRVKAIIPVHIYGHPADMPAIMEIAERYGLRVIEDCAQAHGASIGGKKVGTWGDMAAFSFYPTKNLGALGDGGAVATNNPALAEEARLVREYGWRDRYISSIAGMNSRLDELHAAPLRVKLRYLDADNNRRQQIAAMYDERLAELGVRLPMVLPGSTHVYHQYVIRTPRRDELRSHLRELGIGTLVHYPMPVHMQPAYRDRVPTPGGMEETEQLIGEILSLPIYPELTDEQVGKVAEGIAEWMAHVEL